MQAVTLEKIKADEASEKSSRAPTWKETFISYKAGWILFYY